MNTIIEQLHKLIELLKKTNADGVDIATVNKSVKEIDVIISLLHFDDTDALGRLSYIFLPEGDINKIAKAGGWTDEFLGIKNEVDNRIGIIRMEQKADSRDFNGVEEGKYTDETTYASSPGMLMISSLKWKDIAQAYKLNFFQKLAMKSRRAMVQERLSYGDTQPAMVLSVSPFIVAAYSDEMDAVILLEFPVELAQKNNLKQYDRLVAVNSYWSGNAVNYDIFVGKNYLKRWVNFDPLIGDLLSTDNERIQQHKKNIPEWLWNYVRELGEQYLLQHGRLARKGFWFVP